MAAVTSRPRSHRPDRVIFQARLVEVFCVVPHVTADACASLAKLGWLQCAAASKGHGVLEGGMRGHERSGGHGFTGPLEGLQVPSSVRDWRPFTLRPTRPSHPETGVRIAHFAGFRGQGSLFTKSKGYGPSGARQGFTFHGFWERQGFTFHGLWGESAASPQGPIAGDENPDRGILPVHIWPHLQLMLNCNWL